MKNIFKKQIDSLFLMEIEKFTDTNRAIKIESTKYC